MSKLDRHTVSIDDEVAAALRPLKSRQTTEKGTSHGGRQQSQEWDRRGHLSDKPRIRIRRAGDDEALHETIYGKALVLVGNYDQQLQQRSPLYETSLLCCPEQST
ncbi:hypothetical protein FOXB_13414 [Fusarium oxysporum f. sp. conglutinans Fo5176]|uniref:Uncharacterized protein n=1 Tax=Fusarium oxysporum (strain Fo5176) TaxID=660025 RepID=F9G432_FUSOF|nr:hypothetical protein FOXB_13414 [Fusarium oxysporum f. sp. conglutinans Fo5176]